MHSHPVTSETAMDHRAAVAHNVIIPNAMPSGSHTRYYGSHISIPSFRPYMYGKRCGQCGIGYYGYPYLGPGMEREEADRISRRVYCGNCGHEARSRPARLDRLGTTCQRCRMGIYLYSRPGWLTRIGILRMIEAPVAHCKKCGHATWRWWEEISK